jgi:hypothetical protein
MNFWTKGNYPFGLRLPNEYVTDGLPAEYSLCLLCGKEPPHFREMGLPGQTHVWGASGTNTN